MPPAPTLVPFSEHLEPTWEDEVNPTVDVLFNDATHDGANRLRVFVFLAATTYSGGNQPISAEVRRILGGAERCGAIDTSRPTDVAFCSTVTAVPFTAATCTLSLAADVDDIAACAGVTGADLDTATVCEALQTADPGDGDARACVYAASMPGQSLSTACAGAGSGQCSYSAAYSPADALARSPSIPFDSELLQTVAVAATSRRDEWHQLLGDFYVLPQQRPCILRLQLRTGGRYKGIHIGPPGPTRNVALWGAVTSDGSRHYTESARDVAGRRVADSIMTNGVTQDEQWFFLDVLHAEVPFSETINVPEIITVRVDLGTTYHVCSFRVEWVAAAQLEEWTLDIRGGTSGANWVEKLNIVHDPSSPGGVSARLVTPYFFECGEATQFQFTMKRSQNTAYGLRELELYGFEVAEHGLCTQACQHGSGCWDARDDCTCVPSWFWRGDTCATDCTVPLSAGEIFCLENKRDSCWVDDGLCGACLDGKTVNALGPGVSQENTPCESYVQNACGDPVASNYNGLARPDDDYGCEYVRPWHPSTCFCESVRHTLVEPCHRRSVGSNTNAAMFHLSAISKQHVAYLRRYLEVNLNTAQEQSVTEVVAQPEEPFSLNIPSVVIFILIGLFACVIACFIVLHNRHSKRARVHNVDSGSGDVEDFDEDEELDEEAAARAARDRFLASQKN
eukprot:COSAG02_NODE_9130_length_2319_cov_1.436036_1_plen_679_part_01